MRSLLCSRETNAASAVKLANQLEASVLAVDVDESFARVLPPFAADSLLRPHALGTTSDTSLKRNLGLALAHGAGWERILFPNIYNEDWFFLLGDGVPFRAARAGQMWQRAFDPFATPRRAAAEEFGDTMAESLFWLLDFGHSLDTAVSGFWGDALYRRRKFIDYIHARADVTPAPARIRQSLEAALGRSAVVTHRLCEDYLGAWRADLETWRKFLDWVPVSSGPDKFAWEVGMAGRLHRSNTMLV